MIGLFIVLFLLDGIFAFLYIKENLTKKGFCYKMTAAAIFLINGLIMYSHSNMGRYEKTIILGLTLGLLGDAFLAFEPFIKGKNKKKLNIISSIIGGVFFLGGHIMYIIAFVGELKKETAFQPALFFGILIVSIAIAATAKTLIRLRLGNFFVPVTIYALTLSSMFALGINLSLIGLGNNIPAKVLLFLAPLLFTISDSTIAFKMFDRARFNKTYVRAILLSTYFSAQMLFGFTIYLMK